jgi:hypothetical protein
MNHILTNRGAQAKAAIDNAKTPMQKRDARREGTAVMGELEKKLGDDAAVAAFKKAQPQNSFGVWKGTVSDRPVFMTAQSGLKITGPIKLPDGSMAAPNPQYQIVVPMKFVPAMVARGFVRANSVITNLNPPSDGPARPNAA